MPTRLWKWITSHLSGNGMNVEESPDMLRATFKARYHHFKQLLNADSRALENMAEMEEALHGTHPFGMTFVRNRVTSCIAAVFGMIRHLNELAPGKYEELFLRFKDIHKEITPLITIPECNGNGSYTLDLRQTDASMAAQTGSKMATLGEAKNSLGLDTPEGFVITSCGYWRFIRHNGLKTEVFRIIQAFEDTGDEALQKLSSTIRQRILAAEIPRDLAEAIRSAVKELIRRTGKEVRFAVRSSALGEDSEKASFAGQYRSILNVHPDSILQAYKEVVAGKYGAAAMAYRLNRGIREADVAMCVGCMSMVEARSGGVACSRNPVDIDDPCAIVNSVWGLPVAVVDGSTDADMFVVSRSGGMHISRRSIAAQKQRFVCFPVEGVCREKILGAEGGKPSLTDEQVMEIAGLAQRLEQHFGPPQDIEWALDDTGRIILLQCRPLLRRGSSIGSTSPHAETGVLLSGGITASPGAGAGRVFLIRHEADALRFPKGGVLVATKASPSLAAVLDRAAAVVTEHGSITGHLANVAREFEVPAVFGLEGALDGLETEKIVTVDADRTQVFSGNVDSVLKRAARPRISLMQGSGVHTALKKAMKHITPLNLTDPDAVTFSPRHCRTLHDITRFCHEKSVQEMFNFGNNQRFPQRAARRLCCEMPMQFWVVNLDDGFAEGADDAAPDTCIQKKDITSIPMLSLWEGMWAVPWEGPPPVDVRGLISVFFESTMNPGLEAAARSDMTTRNYFMVSRHFCNLQSRFGYHFCTVESLVGDRPSENYVSFRFQGGAADYERRLMRVRFIASLLDSFGFETRIHQDNAHSRFEGHERAVMESRLRVLGYLVIHTRQLDMVMTASRTVADIRERMVSELTKITAPPRPNRERVSWQPVRALRMHPAAADRHEHSSFPALALLLQFSQKHAHPVLEHLHRKQDEDQSHEPFRSPDAPFSEHPLQRGCGQHHPEAGQPGDENRPEDHQAALFPAGIDHDRGQQGGAGDERRGNGHDERVLVRNPVLLGGGKDQPHGDDKQDHPAGHPQGGLMDPEQDQQTFSQKVKQDDDPQGDKQLPENDPSLPDWRKILENGQAGG